MRIEDLTLHALQPSQFYISEKKLADVRRWLDPDDLTGFEPIPVRIIDREPVMTDGHTRAAAALMAGLERVPLVWETDELGWGLYRKCVAACKERGVRSPADLTGRILPEAEYDEKWNKWCDALQAAPDPDEITVVPYTEERIPDVLTFERRLREEEPDWGWEIDDAYIKAVTDSFRDGLFRTALSLLAYEDGRVSGRIDAVLLPSRFDGSVKAYLDWICVLKSRRHRGVAQALMNDLRDRLKEKGADTLIGLTASNDEAQRFYRAVPDSLLRDLGIWIDIK